MPLPALQTSANPLARPLPEDPDTGWGITYVVKGRSPRLRSLSFHASVLSAGRSAHPPHSHGGEELMVVLRGPVNMVLPTEGGDHEVGVGQCGLIAAGLPHGLRAPDDAAASYLIIRWVADMLGGDEGHLRGGVYHFEPADGSQPFLEGSTDYLRRLSCRYVTLAPGESEPEQVVPHEVALVLFDGEIETAGTRVAPNGIVVYRGGEPRTVRNLGEAPASYLAVEFEAYPASRARRLFETVRWYTRTSPMRKK